MKIFATQRSRSNFHKQNEYSHLHRSYIETHRILHSFFFIFAAEHNEILHAKINGKHRRVRRLSPRHLTRGEKKSFPHRTNRSGSRENHRRKHSVAKRPIFLSVLCEFRKVHRTAWSGVHKNAVRCTIFIVTLRNLSKRAA